MRSGTWPGKQASTPLKAGQDGTRGSQGDSTQSVGDNSLASKGEWKSDLESKQAA